MRVIGHAAHFGFRATHTVAPKSISPWLKSKTCLCGTSASDTRPQLLPHRVRLGIAAPDEHAKQDARDVGVQDGGALTECEAPDRAGGVRADALEGEQRGFVGGQLAAVTLDRLACDRMKPARPDVVAERPPRVRDVALVRGRERRERRVAIQPLVVLGQHAVHLRLLQHHFRDEDVVRIAGAAPGQIPAVGAIPRQQCPRRNRCRAGGLGREDAGIDPYNSTRDPSTALRVTPSGVEE